MTKEKETSEFGGHDAEPSILVKARKAVAKTFGVFTGTNLLPTIDLDASTGTNSLPHDPEAAKKAAGAAKQDLPAPQFGIDKSKKDKAFSESTNMNRMVKGFVQNQKRQAPPVQVSFGQRSQPAAIYAQRRSPIPAFTLWLLAATFVVGTIYVIKTKPAWYRSLNSTFVRIKKPTPKTIEAEVE